MQTRLLAPILACLASLALLSCNTGNADDVYTVIFNLDSTRVGKFDSVKVQIYNGPAPGPGDTLKPVQVEVVKPGPAAKQVKVELDAKVKKDFTVVITGYSGKVIVYRNRHTVDGFAAPDGSKPDVLLITGMEADALVLSVGETRAPSLTFLPPNAGDKRFMLASRDSSVVKAVGGNLTGLEVGETTVVAYTPDSAVSAAFSVSVIRAKVGVRGVESANLRGLVGDTLIPELQWDPENASDKGFTLSSADTAIAEVLGGRIIAKALGNAEIELTSSDGGFRTAFSLTVGIVEFKLDVLPITTLKCSPCHVPGTTLNFQDSVTLLLNGSKVLDRLERPSGDPARMPVKDAPNGALQARQLQILLAWLNVRVVPLKAVAVANDSVKLGRTKVPSIAWDPPDASNKSFTLLSLDTAKVEVSGTRYTGKALGLAQVQLRTLEGDRLVTFAVTVIPVAVDSIRIADTTATMGDTLVPVIHFHPVDATAQTYSLTKLRPASGITTVLPGKRIVANALGKDTLVATSSDGGKVSQFTVTVGPVLPAELIVPDTNGTVNGPLVGPRPIWKPANTTNKTFTLSIDPADTAIAAVRGQGSQIQGKALGEIKITATSTAKPSVTATFKFTVGPVLVIGLSAAPITTYPGLSLSPVLTWNPANATNQAYTLSSGDTAKVKIVANQASTRKLGSTTVTVTSVEGGKTAPWNLTLIRTPFHPVTGDPTARPYNVIMTHCAACHTPVDTATNWQDSATAVGHRTEMLRRTALPLADPDHMPPNGSPQPLPADLTTLRNWLLQE